MSNLVAFLRQLDDAGDSVVPAVITWADPAAITYGTALAGGQLNATANTSGTFVYTPPLGTILNAGNDQVLSVTFTPDDTANYSSATATVLLDVLRASLTITAQNKSKVYGAAVPALTASYSGFVNGDTAASLDAPVTLSTVATAGSPVGSYTINAGGAADANYSIAFVSGTLSVTRAALTITAQDKAKAYGAANPALTAAYSGFVNGDIAASLDTPVTLATTATTSSGVGTYPITASGAADANYTITHANGTLTVTRASLTVRADDKSRVINQPNPPLTATYTGFVNGDTAASLDSPVSLSTTAIQSSPIGTYPITVSGASDANYIVTHVNGTLTVTPTFAVKINFQPASSPIPAGYLPDGGSVFGNRGNGYSYGWNVNNASFAKDRDSTRSPDERYDTFHHTQKSSPERVWEIAVPNGSYDVFVVSGDADRFDSVFRVNVEGVLTVSGTPTTSTRWISGTRTVTVNDGRLTVSNGSGADNNKICFIDIASTPVAGSGIVQAAGGIRLDWIEGGASGHITLRVEGIESPGALCEIEASSDLTTWNSLGVLPVIDGTVSFNDAGSEGHPQRFYRVRSNP